MFSLVVQPAAWPVHYLEQVEILMLPNEEKEKKIKQIVEQFKEYNLTFIKRFGKNFRRL